MNILHKSFLKCYTDQLEVGGVILTPGEVTSVLTSKYYVLRLSKILIGANIVCVRACLTSGDAWDARVGSCEAACGRVCVGVACARVRVF